MIQLGSMNTEGFEALKHYLIAQTGLHYYLDKDDELRLKLRERMTRTRFTDYQEYYEHLINAPGGGDELEALIQHLTIGETYFFRYREQFSALKEIILPELIKARQQTKRLTVWSAGCASGEEIYSISILLRRLYPELESWQLDLLGTDLNIQALERAEAAVYRDWSFRQNPDSFRQDYFRPTNAEASSWELLPAYRRNVRFRRHNLTTSLENLGSWDLILCRNVLIYFAPDTQKRVIAGFYQHLAADGRLLLGPSELSPISCAPFHADYLASLSCFSKGQQRHNQQAPASEPLPALVNVPLKNTSTVKQVSQNQVSERNKTTALNKQNQQTQLNQPTQPAQLPNSVDSPEVLAKQLTEIRRLADTGQLSLAQSRCHAWIEQQPMQAAGHFTLALILTSLGQDEEALNALRRTLYLDPECLLAHYQLGLLEQARGRTKSAARAYRNALELIDQAGDEQAPVADQVELSYGRLRRLIITQQAAL